MARQAVGKVKRIVNGLPHFAEVAVTVEPTCPRAVTLRVSGRGFRSQGVVETVPTEGYDQWKEGALRGAHYALRTSDSGAAVLITEIAGLSTDTNPSIVALATARAVWEALGIDPSTELTRPIEAVAFASWTSGAPELPALPP